MLHATRISLPERERVEIIGILNQLLASTTDLHMQLKQAHWNVKGPEFIALHKLFDDIAEQVEEQVDIIAERITTLGGTALGTLQEAAKNTGLRTYPTNIFSAKDHIEYLTHNIALLGETARTTIKTTEGLGDLVTSELCIELTTVLDKNLWFIEAHVQK